MSLSKKLDQLLLDLAWSLWTELGVAGIKRKHQNFLIPLEELILLTVALMEIDPRLRDESLDWCSQYHRFFSISRLKATMKNFEKLLGKAFSIYSVTLNSFSKASWPFFLDTPPLKVILGHKSCLRPLESAALLNIRARSLFGAGARADLVTFFSIHPESDFAISDLVEIGYSKRNLAEILEEFSLSGLFDKFLLRNQQRFRLSKNYRLTRALSPIPKYAPSWRFIFEVVLSLRDCIKRTENSSESTKVVEIRNLLATFQTTLQRLNLKPPPTQTNFQVYLDAFDAWILEIVRKLSEGDFPNKSFLTMH